MAYYHAYQAVLTFPDRRFPDIQAMLRTGRRDGKAVSQLICHVVQWVNPSPTKVGDRENNKPPLWRDLIWPFRAGSSSQGDAEGQAQELQRRIFDVVRHRVTELSDLSKMPDANEESYLERFESPIWKDILVVVYSMVGSGFHGVVAKFNQQDPTTLALRQDSTVVSAIFKAIRKVPDIAQNPALRTSQAFDILIGKLSPVIITWASEQCTEALRAQELGQAPPLPPSVLKTVSSELEKLKLLLPLSLPSRHAVPSDKSKAIRRSPSRDSTDHWTSSPPRNAQPAEVEGQSPVASEPGMVPTIPGDQELPRLVRPTAMNLEIDEAELRRRRCEQRRRSGRSSTPPHRKPAANQGTSTLPSLGETKAVPTNKTVPWTAANLFTTSRLPSSKGKRSWGSRPAAQSKRHPLVSASREGPCLSRRARTQNQEM